MEEKEYMKKTWFVFLICVCWLLTAAFLFLPLWAFGQGSTPTPTAVLKFEPPAKKPFRLNVTGWDVLAWGLDGVSGVAWGGHEAFQADPYVFERRGWQGAFWRHDAWLNKYEGRQEGGAIRRSPIFGHTFQDVDHFMGTAQAFLLSSATVTITLQGRKAGDWKSKLSKAAIGYLVRSAAAGLTYSYLRKK